jgi:HTH-type transcriptional repressor of NAD biosynthesis genes
MALALVLMAALPPTRGHAYLIDFASRFVDTMQGQVVVAVCNSGWDPITSTTRVLALRAHIENRNLRNVTVVQWDESGQPSKSADPVAFWAYWQHACHQIVSKAFDDVTLRLYSPPVGQRFIIASDLYGKDLAREIGWEFVPCNTYREVMDVSGTRVRTDPIGLFDMILPEFQPWVRKTITIFGPESCGKTTMARKLASDLNGHFVPEWAREYMEVLRTNVITDDLMLRITQAQAASQIAVHGMRGKPFIFQDTDLLSTIGYYRIYGGKSGLAETLFRSVPGTDLYVVMNDGIPFTPDFLRLGVTKRESDVPFWTRLLDEFRMPYHVVRSTYRDDQEAEIREVVQSEFMRKSGFAGHIREQQ